MVKIINKFKENYERRKKILLEEGIFRYLGNSSGYVLIIVLIMTTLMISLSGEFIVVAQTNIGYIKKLNKRAKASFMANSGVQLSKYILYADTKGLSAQMLTGKSTDKNIDSYNDIWAIDFPEVPIDDISLQLQIVDENSKINLSVLANEFTEMTKFYYITQNFFMNMGLSPDLADIIHDWVDIDDSRMPYGAESSDYYMTLTPPYQAKNGSMDSIDELFLLKGITPGIFYGKDDSYGQEENLVEHNKGNVSLDFDKILELTGNKTEMAEPEENDELINIGREKSRNLSDYFTVYGDRSDYTSQYNKININTASYRVLSALTDNMTPDIVTEIINRRLVKPYSSVDEIADLIDDQTIRDRLSVQSHIFRIISTATIDNVQVKINAVYNRSLRKTFYWCEE